tara:strand:- start:221 stop:1096 length:876 start_codon:yes stop_codon:yes gene_type:complete
MTKRKAYVVGANVSTSMSPAIFEYWFKKFKITSAEYDFIEIKEDRFDKEIGAILKEKNLVGLNITIPYKEKIFLHINKENKSTNPNAPTIKKTPINCLTIRKQNNLNFKALGKIVCRNTDETGFEDALNRNTSFKKKSCCAIVLGYGGASKAIISSLLKNPYFDRIVVFNRTYKKLQNITEEFGKGVEFYELKHLFQHTNKASLIVNTSPVNILGDEKKWSINANCFGFDIVYRPWDGTGFLRHFKKENRIEGIQMLVGQAAPCFEEWFGIKPDTKDKNLFEFLYKKMKKT